MRLRMQQHDSKIAIMNNIQTDRRMMVTWLRRQIELISVEGDASYILDTSLIVNKHYKSQIKIVVDE
jgi:hypothetical protein